MNRICAVVVGVVFCFFNLSLSAQTYPSVSLCSIDAYPVSVSCDQTTNIIFPYSIKSVDRGSVWVLAQKAKGAENVLQVKAGRRDFDVTNLTVICGDGQLYSFLLSYAPFPSLLNLRIEKVMEVGADSSLVQLSDQRLNENEYAEVSKSLRFYKPFLRLHRRSQMMEMHLKGIYLARDLLWFAARLSNASLIKFIPAGARFFIRDKKRTRRTAVQEKEIIPVYHTADSVVGGRSCRQMLFAFASFTLPKSQQLFMQVAERNGGRQITLRIKPKHLLKASALK